MATYANNTTIKIQTPVSGTVTVPTGVITVVQYTCPANSYAILNVSLKYDTTPNAALYGFALVSDRTASCLMAQQSGNPGQQGTIYLGPGQTLKFKNSSPNTLDFDFSGVEFKNSP